MIVALCGGFGGREEERLSGASMWPHATLVEKGDRLRDALAHPDLAQDVDEIPLVLSIDELKRDRGDRNVLQGMSTEGIRGVVASPWRRGRWSLSTTGGSWRKSPTMTIWTPPKGRSSPRIDLNRASMASMRSTRTIEIPSMTRRFMRR